MKKAIVSIFLAATMLLTSAAPIFAAERGAYIFVDGEMLPNTNGINKNGSIFVPFRAIFEKMGLSVTFDAESQQVSGEREGLKISFFPGSKTAYVNGEQRALTAAPFVQSGTTYVPIRIIGESTGNLVTWTREANIVQVISPSFKGVTYRFEDGQFLTLYPDGTINAGKGPSLEEDLVYFKDISDPSKTTDEPGGPGSGLPQGGVLKPDTEIEEVEGPGYKGYPDSADITYQMAVYEGRDELPPLMSEGWISAGMLVDIEGVHFGGTETPYVVGFMTLSYPNEKVLATLDIGEEIGESRNGSYEVDGIRIIKYYGNFYFNIEDLKRAGIISE